MLRDVKSVPSRAPVSPVPLVTTTRVASAPSHGSAPHQAPLTLFDPYSQQMIVCTKPGTAPGTPELAPAPSGEPTGGTSKVLLAVQIALLASVAVMVWFMLGLLRATA